MTLPIDDTLTAIGRQLSAAYLPTVQEPLPRELTDLVLQLVASEAIFQRSGYGNNASGDHPCQSHRTLLGNDVGRPL